MARYADRAFGVGIEDCAELTGGGFAAMWRVTLADRRLVVLKVGPPSHVRLLRYEAGLIAAEARYPATPLASGDAAGDGSTVRRQLGAAIAHLHTVAGDQFGFSGARARAST